MADKGRQVGHYISVIFITNKALHGTARHKTVVPARRATLCGDKSGVGSGDVVCGGGATNISHSPVWRRLDGDSRGRGSTHAPCTHQSVPATHTTHPLTPCFILEFL